MKSSPAWEATSETALLKLDLSASGMLFRHAALE
jgi:hypothetical protein